MTTEDIAHEMYVRMASQFVQSQVTKHEHYIYRDELKKRKLPLPWQDKAIRFTVEYVDEGVLCDGGGK